MMTHINQIGTGMQSRKAQPKREMSEMEYFALTSLYEQMPMERRREFWQLSGGMSDKTDFLLRHGRTQEGGRA